ncbi:MAG: LUD domain-containing protein [Acidimicrobiia bacterium]|nr:LUD domain-containing protein [Acidimicrobiia bacterium]MDH4307925.1 LUD domain-containing protein [Acidimicrobiia bacterium]MDH5293428.1 LUD domain-containing protein [Acidimicrobiia bacterium]
MDRETFLSRVDAATQSAQIPGVPSATGLLVPELGGGDLVELFRAAAEGVGVEFIDDSELASVAAAHAATSFLAWDGPEIPAPDVGSRLVAAGLQPVDPRIGGDRRAHLAGYHDVVLGVTGAHAGFAETGSVVVSSGAGRPRMASLIPAVHVVYLKAVDIHRSLAHWAAADPGFMAGATNVVFITGVSRTGDIEMKLNTGVHGPGHLYMVIL